MRQFGEQYPLVLAGGLSAANICDAIEAALPDVVDVSSGVESHPGHKDIEKIRSFFQALDRCRVIKSYREVY